MLRTCTESIRSLDSAYQRSAFSRSSRDVQRLTQLGFLRSSRWDFMTSTQYFGILDIVDDERVNSLACNHSEFCGTVHAMKSEVELLARYYHSSQRSRSKYGI